MKIVLQREGSREHKVCLRGVPHLLSFIWNRMLVMIICAFFLEIPKTFNGRGDSMLSLCNGPLKMSVLHESYVSSPVYSY